MEATNIKVFKTDDRDMELITFEFNDKFYIYVIVMDAHICSNSLKLNMWKISGKLNMN
jgi:hypothetical protein